MIRLLYNLLFPIGLLLFLPAYLRKMIRRGAYRHKFGQRLGFYDAEVRERLAHRGSFWMHAVSVGEVVIALKLVAKLRQLSPDLRLVLTTTTTTGFALASKEAPAGLEVMYCPLDWWPIMRRAFAVIRPVKIVLVEAEVWPNLTSIASARGIPVLLVNARLSARSERRFGRFAFAVRSIFRLLERVCVPEPDDVHRWMRLGVSPERIECVGSIKFDSEEGTIDRALPAAVLEAFGIRAEQPILLGGSTHRGEEKILGEIFLDLRREFPGLCLLIAPRHVERRREISEEMTELGLSVALRSAANAKREQGVPDCLLLDSTGELRNWYSVATVAFVGKSLTTNGGQNPVEPIMAGKPPIFGPHMENFAALAEMLVAKRAAIQVSAVSELREAIRVLLRDPAARAELVSNGRKMLEKHRGATGRTAILVLQSRPCSQQR